MSSESLSLFTICLLFVGNLRYCEHDLGLRIAKTTRFDRMRGKLKSQIIPIVLKHLKCRLSTDRTVPGLFLRGHTAR